MAALFSSFLLLVCVLLLASDDVKYTGKTMNGEYEPAGTPSSKLGKRPFAGADRAFPASAATAATEKPIVKVIPLPLASSRLADHFVMILFRKCS